jgi:hypothetical protein
MLVLGEEFFLPFEEYPWFQDARIREIQNVELLFDSHLHWPDLDVDLELEALAHPERYPLKYEAGEATGRPRPRQRARRGRLPAAGGEGV